MKKMITKEDLKTALDYCDYTEGSFDIDTLWNALKKKAKLPKREETNEFFTIGDYVITRFPKVGLMEHLSVSRKDGKPIRSWKQLQMIKNKVFGEDREACELYPCEARVVDFQNTYHLWVLPPKTTFPFGIPANYVV